MTIGTCEAEAIRRGEDPQWVAVARSLDRMDERLDAAFGRLDAKLTEIERQKEPD